MKNTFFTILFILFMGSCSITGINNTKQDTFESSTSVNDYRSINSTMNQSGLKKVLNFHGYYFFLFNDGRLYCSIKPGIGGIFTEIDIKYLKINDIEVLKYNPGYFTSGIFISAYNSRMERSEVFSCDPSMLEDYINGKIDSIYKPENIVFKHKYMQVAAMSPISKGGVVWVGQAYGNYEVFYSKTIFKPWYSYNIATQTKKILSKNYSEYITDIPSMLEHNDGVVVTTGKHIFYLDPDKQSYMVSGVNNDSSEKIAIKHEKGIVLHRFRQNKTEILNFYEGLAKPHPIPREIYFQGELSSKVTDIASDAENKGFYTSLDSGEIYYTPNGKDPFANNPNSESKVIRNSESNYAKKLYLFGKYLMVALSNNEILYYKDNELISVSQKVLMKRFSDKNLNEAIIHEINSRIKKPKDTVVIGEGPLQDGHIINLDLSKRGLAGKAIRDLDGIQRLKKLRRLDLRNNFLDIRKGSETLQIIQELENNGVEVIYKTGNIIDSDLEKSPYYDKSKFTRSPERVVTIGDAVTWKVLACFYENTYYEVGSNKGRTITISPQIAEKLRYELSTLPVQIREEYSYNENNPKGKRNMLGIDLTIIYPKRPLGDNRHSNSKNAGLSYNNKETSVWAFDNSIRPEVDIFIKNNMFDSYILFWDHKYNKAYGGTSYVIDKRYAFASIPAWGNNWEPLIHEFAHNLDFYNTGNVPDALSDYNFMYKDIGVGQNGTCNDFNSPYSSRNTFGHCFYKSFISGRLGQPDLKKHLIENNTYDPNEPKNGVHLTFDTYYNKGTPSSPFPGGNIIKF